MAWYVNDLSLCGQYSAAPEFLKDLKELIRQRQQLPILARELFCSRTLHTRPVTRTNDFREAVLGNKELVHLVLSWLTKNGPFWDDEWQPNEEEYFEHNGEDVTNQGLGEAARRQLVGQETVSFSFPKGGFDYSPVEVVQGLDDPSNTIPVNNLWDLTQLWSSACAATPPPHNWREMLEQSRARFNSLAFSDECIDELLKEPFSDYVVERTFELLRVLDEFVKCLNADGSYSQRNNELIAQHFAGGKALFTDESVQNKHRFRKEMTFPDFDSPEDRVFCPWHGKIKSPQYRIHFEWPLRSRSVLRIFYMGPKITKI